MPTSTLQPDRRHAGDPADKARPRRRPSFPEGARLGVILGVPAILLLATSVMRWRHGYAGIDLNLADQAFWSAAEGHGLFSSILGQRLLEDHFSPGWLGFTLLYRLVATPVWMLAAQAAAVWVAVYLICRRVLPAVGLGWASALGAALLLAPSVAYPVLFDAHPIVLGAPFGVAAVFAIEDGRNRAAFLFGLAATLFRVELGIGVLAAAAFLPGARRPRSGFMAALGAYVAGAFILENHLGTGGHWAVHFGHLGNSPGDALLHPWRIGAALFTGDVALQVLPWVLTTGLVVRRPRLLLPAAVVALPVLVSQWGPTHHWHYHYGLAPTLFLAAAWVPVVLARPEAVKRVVVGCVAAAALFGPVLPGLFESIRPSYVAFLWGTGDEATCMAAGIPVDVGVSATSAMAPLAHRTTLYWWPTPFRPFGATAMPNPRLNQASPRLADKVDYLIIPRVDGDQVPDGFILDGESQRYLRFRRASTTTGNVARCT